MALIEQKGLEALSMRRLGGELGVEAMSLYYHVGSRDQLVDAIADQLLEPLRELDLAAEWRTACRQFAAALRDIALARPATFRLLGLKPLDTPTSLLVVERLLGVLVDAGFSAPDALAVYRAVASYARGYALAEATGFTVDAAAPGGRKRLRALARDEFPILRGHADELAALDPDSGFERGLVALLDGMPEPSG
jgi:TetR/AcrR family tetracycline transcriptional repressor